MASARVASPKSSYLNSPSKNRVTSSPTSRRTATPTPSAATSPATAGRRVNSSARSPVRQSNALIYRRCLLFLLNAETSPTFPFCEETYQARSRIRWPPWPHRLDSGHAKNGNQHFRVDFMARFGAQKDDWALRKRLLYHRACPTSCVSLLSGSVISFFLLTVHFFFLLLCMTWP